MLNKKTYAIDIKTGPFLNSPLKKLEIKSIQLDSQFIAPMEKIHGEMKKRLVNNNLIAFNCPFEQTQLARDGNAVWDNN
jgi:hypothetical protein